LAFPDVVLVDSIESDPDWMSRISVAAKGDARLRMRRVPEPMENVLDEIQLETYDLILVDSSTEVTRRASLIKKLAQRQDFRALVAVHDFEISAYRIAAKPFRNCVECAAYNPCTGILWQTAEWPEKALKELSRTVHRYNSRLQPDDVGSWSATFRAKTAAQPVLVS
jgi:hypothetical protein